MKEPATVSCIIVLVLVILSAGCFAIPGSQSSGAGTSNISSQTNATILPQYNTYRNFGFSFAYPADLQPTELGAFGDKVANYHNGRVQLTGTTDNITISWMRVYHIPPNIPTLFEATFHELKRDPTLSAVKTYGLRTYPNTTCSEATFIGRMSYFDMTKRRQTMEGLILFYHPPQDRMYLISVASDQDYYLHIRPALTQLRDSFRCEEHE